MKRLFLATVIVGMALLASGASQAYELICDNCFKVIKCGDGSLHTCYHDGYQIDCTDSHAADVCADHGGIAAPPTPIPFAGNTTAIYCPSSGRVVACFSQDPAQGPRSCPVPNCPAAGLDTTHVVSCPTDPASMGNACYLAASIGPSFSLPGLVSLILFLFVTSYFAIRTKRLSRD
jgi:hypothetical protein